MAFGSTYTGIILLCLLSLSSGDDVTINTRLGQIVGTKGTYDQSTVFVFSNIPFAKPPVGDLRFAKPVPYGSWTGTLNATTTGNQCMQYEIPNDQSGVQTSEDCLNLNIYVPRNISQSAKKPVMVWIYGGGFIMGSAHFYDSRPLALHGDVIVVTIQYRLGIFGFFSLGKNEALGNYGLWDQMLALEWVHQNIDSFGGDPTSVTIFGESAGGASVSLLSLIPRNKDKFHRVIAQSGMMTASWATTNTTEASFAIGEMVGCSRGLETTAFLGCLQNINSTTLLNKFYEYVYRDPTVFPYTIEFGPVVDGELFKMAPEELLKNRSSEEYKLFSSLDFMTGTMKVDGNEIITLSEDLQKRYNFNLSVGISSDEFCNIFVQTFTSVFFKNNSFISSKLCDEYTVKNNVSEQSRQMLDMHTDFFFSYPAFQSLRSHSQDNVQSNTYHYVFEYDSASIWIPPPPSWYIGPGHADELVYMFPFVPLSKEQEHVSSVMMTYWTNFAKHGNPNDPLLADWPVYDNQKEAYLIINANQSTGMKYRNRQMEVWQRDIPQLIEVAPTGTITIPTKLGLITGNINYIDDDYHKKLFTFYNIPFAKPPVGNLRFAKPEPYGGWSGTLNATVFGNQCMQYEIPNDQSSGVETSEDCLNLNIYVPRNMSQSAKKPVMVWIYGGGFIMGSAHFYDSRPLALHGDVIVVTIQYRLGIFGFFSLGKNEALGNYGLWDQMLALEWVHQNIDSFGGDPTSVTIFGESAGGASVSLLSLIPRNKDKFHRVIAQSGMMTASWANTNTTEASFAIGEMVGCSRGLESAAFLGCLQNINSTTLLNKFYEYVYRDPTVFPYTIEFGPVVDGELFKMAPEELLKNRSSEEYKLFSSLDFMTGTMKVDGNEIITLSEDLQKRYNFNLSVGISSDEFCNIFVQTFTSVFFKNNSFISSKLCDEYTVKNNVSEQSRQMLDMHTDFFFSYPAFQSLRSHSQDNVQSNTYHYVFEYDSASIWIPPPPSWYIGPGHADELVYMFPFVPLSKEQEHVSSVMMTYWTNFAKHGDPNDPSLADWPVYDNQKEAYLILNANQSTGMKYRNRQMEIWQRDIPQLIEVAPTGTITIPTKLGLITGNINYIDNDYHKKVFTFYNIPFAKPPVGHLRFAKPEPYGGWTGTLNGTVFGNQCMQPLNPIDPSPVGRSEDCLNLNIYVPRIMSTSVKRPVMVWIYGGAFVTGSAHFYDSKGLALAGDVIVVTIQYRLGIFGFFSLGTSEALGNFAFWDQMLALEWVHQNIDSFGGDPMSVTIFGESAGGASVSLLSLIPRNKNRFHRVIAQSGTMTAPWAMTNATEASYSIGELAGCSRSLGIAAFVQCVRNTDANTLLNIHLGYIYRNPFAFPYVTEMGPVVDGDLFEMKPEVLLKNYSSEEFKFFTSLDYMTGTLKSDGDLIPFSMTDAFQKHHGFNLTTGISTDEFCDIIVSAFTRDFFQNNSFISRKICEEYQVKYNVSEQSRQMVDLFTDFLFAYPAFVSLQHHSQNNIRSNTFHYVFELDGPSLMNASPPDWYIGPGHADELVYLFPFFPLSSEQQKNVSLAMMEYWTNFAYNGNPNGPSLPTWEDYDNQKEAYLIINTNLSTAMRYKEQRMSFWQEEIPRLMESAPTGTITIPTRLGSVTGKIIYIDNDYRNKVLTFYNIPFAKPPVGDLRFRKPVPYGGWTGTLDATAFGNKCMQFVNPAYQLPGVVPSEDCLILNIYVPNNVSLSAKRPVMVWVHGGGFTSDSAHTYDSGPLALQGDVIVVNIQYRLGIFGFFSLGKSEALGNYGLWDQMLALEWVHQNIDSFGGDPTSVTIFGESAGGVSVSLLSVIPRNKDKFHRVIAQSGLMTASWSIANGTEASYAIGEMTGCPKTLSTPAFVSCMQNLNSSALLNSFLQYTFRNPIAFPSVPEIGPVIDGELFRMSPISLRQNYSSEEYQFFASLDFMTGTVKADGNLVLNAITEAFQKYHGVNLSTGISSDEFCAVFARPLTSVYFKNNSLISDKICEKYQVKNNISQQSRQMIDMYTDFFFAHPAFESLYLHSRDNLQAHTFHYVFELDLPSIILASPPSWYIGPGHGDDLYCLFPFILFSGQTEHACSVMRKYWINFAKTGNPNGPSLPKWEDYDNQKKAYLIINTNLSTAMRYKEQRMSFWQEEIPRLMESAPTGTITIPTRLGSVTGKIIYIDNDYRNKILIFYNIPFAKPPVGDLRFRKPVPYGGWTGTLDATAFGNKCMQFVNPAFQSSGGVPSEDCLILNIYVPNNVSLSAKRPVMVWVHGGGFTSDSAHAYDSGPLALQGDVIVVNIQYRLGIFGFFSLGKSEALGNYGLWDQMLALEWVHQNIDSFGGDPTSVTIFGESAGGISVSLLSVIPRNKDKFHRVIAQSGTIPASWTINNGTEASYAIGEMAGCPKTLTTPAFISCMQNLNSSALLKSFLQNSFKNPTTFPRGQDIGPVIDGELFRMSPISLLQNYSSEEYQFFASLDFMTGTAKADGNLVMVAISEAFQKYQGVNLSIGISSDEFCTAFARPFTSFYFKNNSLISDKICEKYQVKHNISQQSRQMIDMYTDFLFAHPAFERLNLHSRDNLQAYTFHYVFELDLPTRLLASPPSWYIGPGHTDDLYCLFPFIPLTGQREHVCSLMRKYWINFAKTGNPNHPSLPFWPTFDTNNQAYIALNDHPTAQTKYEQERLKLWVEDIPRLTDVTSVSSTVVQTPVGKIRGIERILPETPNDKVFIFYNIPFAKPPVGDLRFAKPKPYGVFDDTYNATTSGNACLQPPVYPDIEKYSEDCLQLNIYVPHNISTSTKKSVMVWIHGGGYALGSAVQNDGSILATKGGVIVVTVNYRLGVFGFFSLNDITSRGNYGLWDQILALQWVKDNIASFGGNPDSVTLFGESAGGFSVSLLSLVPQNEGLFHRVIAQSGTALAPLALGDPRPGTIEIGKLSQCEHNYDSETFIRCMRNKSAEDISKHYLAFASRNPLQLAPNIDFMPCIDNELFRKAPSNILQNTSSEEFKFFSSLDLISGVMKQEGSLLFDYITPDIQTYYNFDVSRGIPTEFVCNFYIPALTDFIHFPGNPQLIKSTVCDKYKDTRSQTHQARQTLNFLADVLFTVPMAKLLDAHSSNNVQSRTFQYLITKDYPYPFYPYPSWFQGPAHGDDVGFIFQYCIPPKDNVQEYLAVSDKMITYWSNFAKNGDPNDNSMVRWPAYNTDNRGYTILDTGTKPDLRYADSRIKFWTDELPDKLTEKPTTTQETLIRDNSAQSVQQTLGSLVLFALAQCLRTIIL